MEAQFGLDQPLLLRYAKWLWAVMHLNLGISLAYHVSVTSLIGSRAVNTIILSAASMLFAWVIAIPIGIIVAVNQNSIWDRVLSFLAFFGMSVPNFFLAFLVMYFAMRSTRPVFPVGGTFSVDYAQLDRLAKIADRINHLILPVFVLGIAGMASLMRLMRSQILEIKNSDFVRTARAKGLTERIVIYKHVLRNALNPFVTMAGYGLADLLGGAALVEAVMNLQGLGLLLLERGALARRLPGDGLGADGHGPAAGRKPARRHRAGRGRSAGRFLLAGLAMSAAPQSSSRCEVPLAAAESSARLIAGLRARMAAGVVAGPILGAMPDAVLFAGDRFAFFRAIRSDSAIPRACRIARRCDCISPRRREWSSRFFYCYPMRMADPTARTYRGGSQPQNLCSSAVLSAICSPPNRATRRTF